MSSLVRASAPAKVNLTLAVLGRRADGYHELDTWMLALSLCDRIEVEPRGEPGLALEISGPAASSDVRADATNLVWRAASDVLDSARASGAPERSPGWLLRLEKHIPSQSGLGGASSDAAATVLALERALDFDLGVATRQALLASLGSDCAFFAARGPGLARCGGRGERVLEIAGTVPDWHLALWVPAARCPTPEVYRAVAAARAGARAPSAHSASWRHAIVEREHLFNDLEAAAMKVEPELVRWRDLFRDLELDDVRLSGSGSAFFALFDREPDARRALERVNEEAGRRALGLRASWVLFPRGHAAKLERS